MQVGSRLAAGLLLLLVPAVSGFADEQDTTESEPPSSGPSYHGAAAPAASRWTVPKVAELCVYYTLNSHWADDEENSFVIHTELLLKPEWNSKRWRFSSELDLDLSYQRFGGEPWRQAQDHLEALAKVVYDIHPWLDAAVHADFLTQMFPGYDYYGDWEHSHYTTNFMAPGTLTYGVGADLTLDRVKFTTVLSPLSSKMIYILDRSLDETLFGLASGATVKMELGAYIILGFEREIVSKTFVDMRGTIFLDYREPGEPDYSFKSSLDFKPVSFLTIGCDFRLAYDRDIKINVYQDLDDDGQYDDFPTPKPMVQMSSQVKTGLHFRF